MSSAADSSSNFPTMIIPRGTEIKLNTHGQLSIKTPGNLVIQNSGVYSELESTNGSIRIEDNVQVEAVSVRAAQACFIQGTLTAWRVHAKKISLEDRAKAYIMLQESEQLELSKTSRLVGNFANEKEIYLMLGKFTPQLKELPTTFDMQSPTGFDESKPAITTRVEPELPEPLRKALAILDHELKRPDLEGASGEALRELVFALRERDLQRTGLVYRDVFTEVGTGSELLRTAYDLLDSYFRRRG